MLSFIISEQFVPFIMADDDELDRLCKSFEDKGGCDVDNTVGYDVETLLTLLMRLIPSWRRMIIIRISAQIQSCFYLQK